MAFLKLLILFPLLTTLIFTETLTQITLKPNVIIPLNCTETLTCRSYMYHISDGSTTTEQIASYYSVNTSQVKPIYHYTNKDYLVSVPCACKELNNTVAYFYDTTYTVQQNDKFKTWMNVTNKIYSGQAWNAGDGNIDPGQLLPIHLVCGCVGGSQSQVVVTYTIQDNDTLPGIATLLGSTLEGIESLNKKLLQNPAFIDVGWVIFVPMKINGTRLQL